nr:hypothetical protein [Marinicella sp. W31]MDC2878074.1 hypothetical protein [Marinicella sp. W31]
MAQTIFGTDIACGKRDEVGLTESGEIIHQKCAAHPAGVFAQKCKDVHKENPEGTVM